MLIQDNEKIQRVQQLCAQKPVDNFELAEAIADLQEGSQISSNGDLYYKIRCVCPDHQDDTPSCILRPTESCIFIKCPVCDTQATKRTFRALQEYGLVPIKNTTNTRLTPAQRIWEDSSTAPAYLSKSYLHAGRKLNADLSKLTCLRESWELWLDGRKDLPGLVFAVTDKNERFVTLQRIFLDDDDDITQKAKIENPKRLVSGLQGGHINFQKGTTRIRHFGEGPETTLAILLNLPSAPANNDSIWSVVTAANFETVEYNPDEFDTAHIWADRDKNDTGLKHATVLADTLFALGKTVYLHVPKGDLGDKKSLDFDDCRDQVTSCYLDDAPYGFIEKDEFGNEITKQWLVDNVKIPNNFSLEVGDSVKSGVYARVHKKASTSKSSEDTSAEPTEEYLVKILDTPIYISHILRNSETNEYFFRVKFYDRYSHQWHDDIFSKDLIMSPKPNLSALFTFTSVCLPNCKDAPMKLIEQYFRASFQLHQKYSQVVDHLGWFSDKDRLKFAPYNKDLILDKRFLEGSGTLLEHVHTAGDPDVFIKNILLPISECQGASIALGLSLVAPLLKPLKVDPFAINFSGTSNSGKSISSRIPTAFFGNPYDLTVLPGSTRTGIAGSISFYQDMPVYLDEIQLLKSDEFTSLIYATGNPGITVKGKQHGGLRAPAVMRSVLITAGEIDAASMIQFNGALNRLVLIDMPPLDKLNAKEAQNIEELLRHNYGWLGPVMTTAIANNLHHHPENLQNLLKLYLEQLHSACTSQIQNRQVRRYAAALVACKILGQLPSPSNSDTLKIISERITEHLVKHFASLAVTREHTKTAFRALEKLHSFEATHDTGFTTGTTGLNGVRYGEYQQNGDLALDPAMLKLILEDDFNVSNIEKEWKAEDMLQLSPTALKRNGTRDRAYINGHRVQCIILKAEFTNKYRTSNDSDTDSDQ